MGNFFAVVLTKSKKAIDYNALILLKVVDKTCILCFLRDQSGITNVMIGLKKIKNGVIYLIIHI